MLGKSSATNRRNAASNGGTAAGGVGEERAAAGVEVAAQGVEVLLGEREAMRGRGCRSGVIDQVRGREAKSSLWLITTSKRRAWSRSVVIRLGTARGATFQSPACWSLAICRALRWRLGRLEVADLADDQLVGGQLAAGGVVDDVLADPERLDDGGVRRGCASALVPVAGEVVGRIDDDGAAAVLDAPEGMALGAQEVLGRARRGGPRTAGRACSSGSGKISFISV